MAKTPDTPCQEHTRRWGAGREKGERESLWGRRVWGGAHGLTSSMKLPAWRVREHILNPFMDYTFYAHGLTSSMNSQPGAADPGPGACLSRSCYIYISIRIHVCMYVCILTVHDYIYIYTCIYSITQTHKHTCVYTGFIYIYVYIYMYIHIIIYPYIH